jgi:hypothetical protein
VYTKPKQVVVVDLGRVGFAHVNGKGEHIFVQRNPTNLLRNISGDPSPTAPLEACAVVFTAGRGWRRTAHLIPTCKPQNIIPFHCRSKGVVGVGDVHLARALDYRLALKSYIGANSVHHHSVHVHHGREGSL